MATRPAPHGPRCTVQTVCTVSSQRSPNPDATLAREIKEQEGSKAILFSTRARLTRKRSYSSLRTHDWSPPCAVEPRNHLSVGPSSVSLAPFSDGESFERRFSFAAASSGRRASAPTRFHTTSNASPAVGAAAVVGPYGVPASSTCWSMGFCAIMGPLSASPKGVSPAK